MPTEIFLSMLPPNRNTQSYNNSEWLSAPIRSQSMVARKKKSAPSRSKPASPSQKGAAPLREIAGAKPVIFTIGHSTRTIEEFLSILNAHGIKRLVDVRSIPKSRRVPQFNDDALAASLREQGIEYVPLKSLGGRRHAKKDSINTAWRNASFRGYADYMASNEFRDGISRLLDLACDKRTAIMCAEAVPWRCHRSLVGDALLVRGAGVQDIMSATSVRPHELTQFAKVDGLEISYPAADGTSLQRGLPLS